MHIRPMQDRILLRPIYAQQSDLIYTPPDQRSQLLNGEVIAVGPNTSVRAGDHVLFTQACKEANADGTMWIRDGDLVGIIDPDAKVMHGGGAFYEVEGRS